MSSACPSSQPSSAKLQTKNTLLSNSRTTNISPVLINDEPVGPKRARTTSTSSVDTIRISPGKKKSTSKKRARASEPSSHGDCDQTFLQDIRRTRQRKLSTDTVRATTPSAVAFPTFSDTDPRPLSPRNESGKKKNDAERKVTPPKLNPGRAAPSVAVTQVSQAGESALESPAAIRHAPPPPIANAIRTRVSSMKKPPSRSTSPHRTIVPTYRTYGFDPLPAYLQDWQPPSTSYVLSDDEDSIYDGFPSSAWKDQWDSMHPRMSDLDLSICFHKKQPFFDVWDLPDDIYIAVPARLHLTLKNPQQWKDGLPDPDLRYIDIRCNTFEYRSPSLDYYPPEYSVSYNGASSTEYADPTIVPADLTRGIIVNKKWNKSFPGNNKTHLKESLITNYGRLPDDSIEIQGEEDDDSISKRGWFFKFMIPIPSWVLRQGNTRAFIIEASAWVGGLDDGGLLRGDTELVISHLRSEREMIKACGQCV